MARFLSAEWLAEMDRAARSISMGPGVDLVLQQVVTGGPEGDVAYCVRVSGGSIRLSPGRCEADITITEDYDTALALAAGALAPQSAFMTGRIRIAGAIGPLMAAGETLAELASALAAASPGFDR